MIEKFFDKTYKCDVSQSTLTRAANRLISEYCCTFGNTVAPDELQEIAKQIKQCVDTTEYEDESNYEYNGYGERIYDKVKYTNEARARAFWDTDEYNDPVYRITWYFFKSESYTKRIGTQTIRGKSYNEILRKCAAAKGIYRYFCTHRPPSRGVELAGELHDLLLNVGIAIIDGQILKANINVGRIKVSISSNAKSVLTICFTYSDGAKLEV